MTKDEILEELMKIRLELYTHISNEDRLGALFDINDLDTLIYKIYLDECRER